MRKFYLKNNLGERKNLQSRKHFFHLPNGLGATFESGFEQLGGAFYAQVLSEQAQINIVGEIAFLENAYKDYRELVDWIFAGQGLSLVYCPYGTQEFYCDVEIDYIQKAEIQNGYLAAPISFLGKTAWYEPMDVVLNFEIDTATGYKKFPYKFPYKFSLSGATKSIDITPTGTLPATIELTAYGEMISPQLTLSNKFSGDIYGRMKLDGLEVPEGSQLKYSSDPGAPGVWLDGVDVSSYLDLAYDSFFTMAPGVTYTLKIDFTGTSQSAAIRVKKYRRAV